MDEDFQSIGVWMDWDDPYETIDPEYMEAAWWAFSNVADNGLVEQGSAPSRNARAVRPDSPTTRSNTRTLRTPPST